MRELTSKNIRFFSSAAELDTRKEMKFSPIKTDKFVLQPVQENEWEDFYQLYSDPEIMKFFDSGKTYDKEKTQALVAEYASAWRQGDLLSPLSIKNHQGEFLGFINLRHAPCMQPGHVEIGFMILKKHQKNDYGTLAATAALKYLEGLAENGYLVKGAPLSTVLATAHPENLPSLRVLEKIGVQEIGEQDRNGQPRKFFYKSLTMASEKLAFQPEELFNDVQPRIQAKL